MLPDNPKDLQVLVPYSTLLGLLELPQRLVEVEKELKYLRRLLGAIRGQQVEIMDKLRGK